MTERTLSDGTAAIVRQEEEAMEWEATSIPLTRSVYVPRQKLLKELIRLSPKGQGLRLHSKTDGSSARIRQSLHNLAARAGYAFHAQTKKDDEYYIVWVTKLEKERT